MNLNSYPSILTVDDVMEILQIGRNKCYELLNSGKLKGFRLGTKTWKIPRKSIEDFIIESSHIHIHL
ncbi:MAG: helix-turn-helix domain-containing protein [Lachnospiraceae bacterium]|nr:helix-turn-helix domain-containing protein [Lachnospiraceae bacterium]